MNVPSIYDVTRDPKGIEISMAEILEEDFCRERVASSMDAADEETERRIASAVPLRTLSPGYYKMATYLFWLEARVKMGTIVAPFAAFECEGLAQVTRARSEFSCKHPRCQGCGATQDSRFDQECRSCHMKFGGKR